MSRRANPERGPVLVVEDDRDIREVVVEALQDEGYEASGASNGTDALHKLRSGGPLPRVIQLDIMMPVMDGRAFRAEQLRDPALASIPVIVMSAHADAAAIAEEMKADLILKKPVQLHQLFAIAARFAGQG
jgi:CheY-like chemotaxis protein